LITLYAETDGRGKPGVFSEGMADPDGKVERFVGRHSRFVCRDVPLAQYTTFDIGGPAELLVEIDSIADLVAVVEDCRNVGIPTTIFGGGSNVLVSDKGIAGLVVINRCRQIGQNPRGVAAEAGARLSDLIDFAIENGWGGLEELAGIPGTVGGAIIGNAGAYGRSISGNLSKVTILNGAGLQVEQGSDELAFGYRTSRLKSTTDIVLRADFTLVPAAKEQLRRRADEIVGLRAVKLPVGEKCAGSYFKNIEDPAAPQGKLSAGKLLEEAGAKSFRVGSAAVSEKHANVIVNQGGAKAVDVLLLAQKMKSAVKAKFGIELSEEVCFLGIPVGGEAGSDGAKKDKAVK